MLVGVATDVAVESTTRATGDLGYRTIVVSEACTADGMVENLGGFVTTASTGRLEVLLHLIRGN